MLPGQRYKLMRPKLHICQNRGKNGRRASNLRHGMATVRATEKTTPEFVRESMCLRNGCKKTSLGETLTQEKHFGTEPPQFKWEMATEQQTAAATKGPEKHP